MTSQLEESIKSALDNSVHDLDAETRLQLASMRQEALSQRKQPSKWFAFNLWVPTAGLAMCGLIAAVLWLPQFNLSPALSNEQTAMMELIDSEDDFETLNDPGFYLWLDELDEQSV